MLEQSLFPSTDKKNPENLSKIALYSAKNFTLSHENLSIGKVLSSNIKQKFKDKYKIPISVLSGLAILFLMASRDCAPMFIQLEMSLKNQDNYKILNQVYTICNSFLPLFAGYITDYIGYHMCLIFLHLPSLLGNLFVLISVFQDTFNLECAVVGRILFAFGGESLQIILMTIVANYYRKSGQIAYGIVSTLSVVFLGYAAYKFVIFVIMEKANENSFLPVKESAVVGLVFNGISFIISIFIVFLERKWQKTVKSSSNLVNFDEYKDRSFLDTREIYPFSFWQSFKNILTFRILTISIVNGLVWGSFFCMINYKSFMMEINPRNIKGIVRDEALFAFWVYMFMSMTSFLAVARYLDETKQKNILIMIGCLLNSFSYIIWSIFYQNYNEINFTLIFLCYYSIGVCSLGVGMGFFSPTIYSSIPMMINEKNITICFGIVSSVTNLLLFVLVTITPSTIAKEKNFLYGKNPFWLLSCFCIVLVIAVEFHERRIRKGVEYERSNNKFYCMQKK